MPQDMRYRTVGGAITDTLANLIAEREREQREAMLAQLQVDREGRLAKADEARLGMDREREKRLNEGQRLANEIAQGQLESQKATREATVQAAHRTEADKLAATKRPNQQILPSEGDTLRAGGREGLIGGYSQNAPGIVTGAEDDPRSHVSQTYKGTPEQQGMEALLASPEIPQHIRDAVRAGVLDKSSLADMLKGRQTTTGSFEDYLTRKYGTNPTPEQITQARKEYGQADDRAFSPRLIITTDDQGRGTQRFEDPVAGRSFTLGPTAQERQFTASQKRAYGVLSSIDELSQEINTLDGIYATAVGAVRRQAAKVNLDNTVAEYMATIQMFTPLLARAVGHVGVLTELDVVSVREGLPKPTDSQDLRNRKMARIAKIMEGAGTFGQGTVGQPLTQRLEQIAGEPWAQANAPARPAPGASPAPAPAATRRYNPATGRVE